MTLKKNPAEYQFIGTLIKKFRRVNEITQTQLAAELGISQGQMQHIESGKHPFRAEHLKTLALTYRLNPNFILGLSKDMYLSKLDGYAKGDMVSFSASTLAKV